MSDICNRCGHPAVKHSSAHAGGGCVNMLQCGCDKAYEEVINGGGTGE